VEAVFKALADPMRRSLLDALFAERLAMTRFGVMKHVRVLEQASMTAG